MGRVAEALKRAEEERRLHRAGPEAPGGVGIVEVPSVRTDDSSAKLSDSQRREALVEPPQEAVPPNKVFDESIVPYYDRSSVVSEQYRSLRTRLLTQNPQNDHRVLAITSAIPREGKSVTTVNLCVILSEIRHFKVLCVDGDFRRSRLTQLLDGREEPGLADLLKGEAAFEDVVQETPIANLHFVGAGETSGQTAADLFSSQTAGAVIRRFQTEFHYTLVDTPPATTVTDVGIIGQMCNGAILLVRLNFTPEPVARRAVRLLRVNKVPILGCLLIGHDDRASGYGYSYYDYYRYYYAGRDSDGK